MSEGSGSRGAGDKRAVRGVSGTEFAGIGIQFAASILVFVFLGVWLDRRLGTTPWLVIICVFVGAAGGFFSMYRKMTAAQREGSDNNTERRS
jgi:F0F1-type ATP synthase assembly protein I